MTDFCLFCHDLAVIDPKLTKSLPKITPVTGGEYWDLVKADMSTFPPYVSPDPRAPANYGKPYSGMAEAQLVFTATLPVLLAGVATKVSRRVVPLWFLYMNGGVSGVVDLAVFDPTFVRDFQEDPSTLDAVEIVKKAVEFHFSNNKSELPKSGTKDFDLTNIIPDVMLAFGDYRSKIQLDFNTIGSVPGNLVGGFGPPHDQIDNQFGHTPSKQDDSRTVTGSVKVAPYSPPGGAFQPPGSPVNKYQFDYAIDFDVKDTIDFCPGNFGSKRGDDPSSIWAEEDLTVPLSRLEASRMVGDLPVKIKYQVKTLDILTINA
jgi:hypothetical protein